MDQVNVLVLAPVRDSDLKAIAAVDPRVVVVDGRGKFEPEYRETWSAEIARRYLGAADTQSGKEERDALLRQADVVCIGFPFPTKLVSRAPRLKWIHQTPAGASNLRYSDVWGSSVLVTTSRGYGNSTAHAEWVLATMLMFIKELPRALMDKQMGTFEGRPYRPRLLAGKTVGVVGLGGIGREVARLSKAVGMRVVATRRSATVRTKGAEGVDELFPPSELHQLLAASDFVVVCTQSTPETEKLIGRSELTAMKSTSYLINLARGEIIDEAALVEALRQGTIAGAALDVHESEFQGPPNPELIGLPNVIFTPHVSGGSDVPTHRGIELFCQNLGRFLSGQELLNVVDWQRGY